MFQLQMYAKYWNIRKKITVKISKGHCSNLCNLIVFGIFTKSLSKKVQNKCIIPLSLYLSKYLHSGNK